MTKINRWIVIGNKEKPFKFIMEIPSHLVFNNTELYIAMNDPKLSAYECLKKMVEMVKEMEGK